MFKRREEWILAGLTAFFLLLIGLIFAWGIKFLVGSFNTAFGNRGASGATGQFKIEEAKKFLKARGFAE